MHEDYPKRDDENWMKHTAPGSIAARSGSITAGARIYAHRRDPILSSRRRAFTDMPPEDAAASPFASGRADSSRRTIAGRVRLFASLWSARIGSIMTF
jgi:hypothetical protein